MFRNEQRGRAEATLCIAAAMKVSVGRGGLPAIDRMTPAGYDEAKESSASKEPYDW